MTQTSIDLSTRALSSTGQSTSSTSSDKETATIGQDFGAMMNTLLAEHSAQSAMATPPAQPTGLLQPLAALGDKNLTGMVTPSGVPNGWMPPLATLSEKNLPVMATASVWAPGVQAPSEELSETTLPIMATPSTGAPAEQTKTEALISNAPTSESETGLTAGAAAATSLMLRAFQIGPHLQVITPQTAAPEGQSLEMFARSQGLDEAALQWLMGTASPSNRPTGLNPADGTALDIPPGLMMPTLPGPGVANLSLRSASEAPASLLAPQQGLATATPWPMASTWVATQPLDTPTQGKTEISPDSRLTGLLQPASGDTSPVQITVIQSDTDHALKPVATAGVSVPVTASEWLKSNTLELHPLKNSLLGKQEPPLKSLDLSHLVTPEIQATLETLDMGGGSLGQDSPAQGHGSFNSRAEPTAMGRTESSAPAAGAPELDSAQRRENIQNLAEKMGQAVGQRILSEIERGQWHLKLSLRPATLGHIEVEMRMRSGEMDAVFTAGQALTRELLNEGMSKLKDTLNQMGMDVASLKVDDGHHRQGGGESTPDRQANVRDNAPSELTETTAPQPVMAPTKMGVDGWDVLV